MASVRFICGTQTVHQGIGTSDSELGLAMKIAFYTPLVLTPMAVCSNRSLGKEDAIISDSLNHASIIDGVRLCKAMRYRYANSDMADLEVQLKQARKDGARHILDCDGRCVFYGWLYC